MSRDLDWKPYIPSEHDFQFPPGARILDVGCGSGNQIQELTEKGCAVIGIDIWLEALRTCRRKGEVVVRAVAEAVPSKDAQFDGILCKVVLPYTKEELAIGEFSRLLKPGGRAHIVGHGIGYYFRYLFFAPDWKLRVYAARTITNTWWWVLFGRRLPGFWGDSIYQSHSRLNAYYRSGGFRLIQETPSLRFCGLPVFTYQLVEKNPL